MWSSAAPAVLLLALNAAAGVAMVFCLKSLLNGNVFNQGEAPPAQAAPNKPPSPPS